MSDIKLNCIIIDDDPLIADLIKHYCSKVPFIEYCISCNNPIDGIQLISNQPFDLVFLDYNMPELDGKGVLEIKQDNSKVIMITSNPDFAVDSYNYSDIIDYLLKPITFERFYKSIEKYQNPSLSTSLNVDHQLRKETFFVKDGNKWIQVQTKDLLYVKSESNYVILFTKNKQVMSLMNLKDLEKELPENFIRIHRSYIVNIKKIEFITADELSIESKLLPIGAKYKNSIKNRIVNS